MLSDSSILSKLESLKANAIQPLPPHIKFPFLSNPDDPEEMKNQIDNIRQYAKKMHIFVTNTRILDEIGVGSGKSAAPGRPWRCGGASEVRGQL